MDLLNKMYNGYIVLLAEVISIPPLCFQITREKVNLWLSRTIRNAKYPQIFLSCSLNNGKKFKLKYFIHISWISKRLKIPKEPAGYYTLTQMTLVVLWRPQTTVLTNWLSEWLVLSVQGEEGGKGTSRAVCEATKECRKVCFCSLMAALYIQTFIISLYNFKFKAIYIYTHTHIYIFF